ncbi:MAG: hypothetical protein ACRDPO_21265 [Streptosporangiaceae bacterium]
MQTGRLPLFCFFVAFIIGFGFIRLSVRMIRAKVRWWPGNVTPGDMHIHHMVFGVVFMVVAGVGGLAAPLHPLGWRVGAAALFGLGTALVLDEFALILHLRDVYWTSAGRLSVDAVFVAAGFTALLLLGFTPVGVQSVDSRLDVASSGMRFVDLVITVTVVFLLAAITLLKGKFWTALLGVFVPLVFIVGAIRLARPGSPWARWRYAARPRKQARADHRDQRWREPVNRLKARFQDLLAGDLSRPAEPPDARAARRHSSSR